MADAIANLKVDADAELELENWRSLSALPDEVRSLLVDWILQAPFSDANFWVGELGVDVLLKHCTDIGILTNRVQESSGRWNRYLCLQVAAEDLACEKLDCLVEECINDESTTIKQYARELADYLESSAGRAKKILDRVRADVGAESYTFYLSSPSPFGNFRLVAMQGIRYPEPVYGNLLCEKSASHAIHDRPDFEHHVPGNNRRSARDRRLEAIQSDLSHNDILYSDFSNREGVSDFVRVTPEGATREKAVVFVNFCDSVSVSEELSDNVRKRIQEIEVLLPDLVAEARESDRVFYDSYNKLMNYSEDALVSQSQLLRTALKQCLQVLGLSCADSIATVHEMDSECSRLTISAHVGDFDLPSSMLVSQLHLGEGVVSWVAIKNRSLLIKDLETSEFGRLHRKLCNSARSEVAVPMVLAGRVVGVLNIESRIPRVFSEESVRLLWAFGAHLAGQVESRRSVASQYQAIRSARKTFQERYGNASVEERFVQLTYLARTSLTCDHVDIWSCSAGDFKLAGTTDRDADSDIKWELTKKPRDDGWTRYVCEKRSPVWVTVNNPGCLGLIWDSGAWSEIKDGPDEVNQHLRGAIECELGIPYIRAGQIVAVMWLKYLNEESPPNLSDLSVVEYFAEATSDLPPLASAS